MEKLSVSSARDVLYEQLARIGKVVVHPKRIELLELLCQGERSVEAVAVAVGLPLTTASTHLQLLRQARLVETRRQGTRVYYRAAGEEVSRFVKALGDLGRDRFVEIQQVLASNGMDDKEFEPVTRTELLSRVMGSDVVVLDVRPVEEYVAGHIPGALSVPLTKLKAYLDELNPTTEIVAYCRGPYCLLAPEAVSFLRRSGFKARRLEDGMPEWRQASLPVAVGAET